eukprot:UN01352
MFLLLTNKQVIIYMCIMLHPTIVHLDQVYRILTSDFSFFCLPISYFIQPLPIIFSSLLFHYCFFRISQYHF